MDSTDKKALRKRLYVDEAQRKIIVQTILQWYFYMSAILLVVCLGSVWMDPSVLAIKYVFQSFMYFWPAILASVILLPLFVYDMLKATNRIAGPVYRVRSEIRRVVAGESIAPIKFRDGDSFQELAEEFNALTALVNEQRAKLKQLSN